MSVDIEKRKAELFAEFMALTEPNEDSMIEKFRKDPVFQMRALLAMQQDQGGKLLSHNFRIGEKYLEFIRDLVHYLRSKGQTTFSQTQALHMGINLLKEKYPEVQPRPQETKAAEVKRNAIITNAIKTTKKANKESQTQVL